MGIINPWSLIINSCMLLILSMEVEGILLGHQAGRGGTGNFCVIRLDQAALMSKVANFVLWGQEASDFLLCQGAKLLPGCPLWKHVSSELGAMPLEENEQSLLGTFQSTRHSCSLLSWVWPESVLCSSSTSRVCWCHHWCRCWSKLHHALDSSLSWGLFRTIPSSRRLVLRIFQDFWSVPLDFTYCSTLREFFWFLLISFLSP